MIRNNADRQYLDLCQDILDNGVRKQDRTGTGTRSVFGRQLRFDLSDGAFPLLTTKQMPFRIIIEELLFFVRGETDLKALLDRKVDIWTRDGYAKYSREEHAAFPSMVAFRPRKNLKQFRDHAAENGFDLGPIYGAQWRSWPDRRDHGDSTIDQLALAVEELRSNPDSRRMLVSAWNPADIPDMALPPCHVMFQLYVADGKLSLQMYQRSADVFLGLPFNIASYAALMNMIAIMTELDLGELIITIGDAHIYENHIEQVETQLEREPLDSPVLMIWCHDGATFEDFTWEHFDLLKYKSHGRLRGEQSF